MDIAVTGGSGRLGRVLIRRLVKAGHQVRSLDWKAPEGFAEFGTQVVPTVIDLNDLPAVVEALRGCDAVAHLAAYTGPNGPPPGVVYSSNTRSSYNILYAASSLGIQKVSLASSVNALGPIGSRTGEFEYLPVDEKHPTFNQDDYSLSKWVMELQADSFARRFPQMTISSLRIHAIPDEPPERAGEYVNAEHPSARNLWGWTLIDDAARAFELALQATYQGHEIFFIIANSTTSTIPSLDLARFAYPNVPIRGDLSGHRSFFDCSKAARLLGWTHQDC